ncbi:hypothetical protein ACVBGC_30290 [Burkholderia stagnalis]
MKSYFLEELDDNMVARKTLTEVLPGRTDPWVILDSGGHDVVAYVNVINVDGDETLRGPIVISADISGRHYNENQKVIDILRRLQQRLGGIMRNDDDEVVG